MRIMQCNLCKILFFENYAIVIYAQFPFFLKNKNALNAFFDEMRIYLMHAFNERECTQCDFKLSIIKQCDLSSMINLKNTFRCNVI